MNFPLSLTFKVAALAPQIYVHDASGAPLCYVRQKMFKLKEHISVFKDETKAQLISEIHADRIIDFSAAYRFVDPEGTVYGSVKRKGLRSIWRTRYEVQDENSAYTIQEGNPWVKVMDSVVGRGSRCRHVYGLHVKPALRRRGRVRRAPLHAAQATLVFPVASSSSSSTGKTRTTC